jgi:hypothetical protein
MCNDEALNIVIYSSNANIHVYIHKDLQEIYLLPVKRQTNFSVDCQFFRSQIVKNTGNFANYSYFFTSVKLITDEVVRALDSIYTPYVQYMQFVLWSPLSFVHLHLPSDSRELVVSKTTPRRLRPCLCLPVPPMLVGDFNCVLNLLDTEYGRLRSTHKCSVVLGAMVAELLYVDPYRVLHPFARTFSWYRRGQTSARNDRVYLPPPGIPT